MIVSLYFCPSILIWEVYPSCSLVVECSGGHRFESHRIRAIENLIRIQLFQDQGAVSIKKMVLPGMAIPMLKIRRPNGRLIFNMEIVIYR